MITSEKITTRMFVGCRITSEMRMHLNKSKEWKQLTITPLEIRTLHIQEIHFQEKDYLGCYLVDQTVTVAKLQEIKGSINAIFKNYCPKYPSENLNVYVLPQLFIA